MTQSAIDRAGALMQSSRFPEALTELRQAIREDPTAWNAWYLAGQCCRFMNDIGGSIEYLSRAADLNKTSSNVLLALGIAFQLAADWQGAVSALIRAIEIDPDYELAYNSLALTQKKAGELDKALHNYDAGAKALARRLVKAMRNSRNSPIFKHRDTEGTLWSKYVAYGALFLAEKTEGIKGVVFPTGEQAKEEERTKKHAGLYWIDLPNDKGETVRLFLPNYFNTFRESLRQDAAYSNLIGNRGTVLELLGRHNEAQQHFDEAMEFHPRA